MGQCLKKVAADRCIKNIYFASSAEASVADAASLAVYFEKYKPAFAINCAAYTAVDKAEDEVEQARLINKTGAGNLAALCKQYKAKLFHISTDFVFKGDKPYPLSEDDATDPIGIYGLTKLEGEQLIAQLLTEHYIIRTSWLYSEYAANFTKTMLKLGAERDMLKIIADQVGTPTYAIDLAGCILDIIELGNESYGIYNYSNEGVASWYDFAKAIFEISQTEVRVLPIRTAEYPTRAQRPAYSVMDKAKIKSTFNVEIPYWRDSLTECLQRLIPKPPKGSL